MAEFNVALRTTMRGVMAACALSVAGSVAGLALAAAPREPPSPDVLSPAQWKKVDEGVDRGLAWLAAQQKPDGSMPTFQTGEPGVTSLAVMAFLSRGHCPGGGPYGAIIDRGIDFVLSQQREDGLLYASATEMPYTRYQGSHTATYNHAIAGLMLGEAYGMTDGKRAEKIRPTIEKAIGFARRLQRRPNPHDKDKFGWRYYQYVNKAGKGEADLSATGWFVMFFRSAKNAEFDIPQEYVDDAVRFVKACYLPQEGTFIYAPYPVDIRPSRAMNGAGLLCLTITGNHDDRIAETVGRKIIDNSFANYNNPSPHDRYHYGAYYCSQAMFMLGGDYWRKFYPNLATTLLANQAPQGNWQPESANNDGVYGSCYTTALAILSLTPPYQMLPIYQR